MISETKDFNRYSYSRYRTMLTCPRKHYYQYVEQIEPRHKKSALAAGELVHRGIAALTFNEDITPIIKEYKSLVRGGIIELPEDQLEYTLDAYMDYYQEANDREIVLATEQKITKKLNKTDYLEVIVDKVVEDTSSGLVILRDTKTTSSQLKYAHKDVMYNQQLLFYVPFIQDELGIKIDAIQIDEIRLAQLKSVPLNTNGKPSTDKGRNELVTYEEYYNTLKAMHLEDKPEYKHILDYLERRGHPLFNRVTVHLADDALVNATLEDFNIVHTLCANKDIKARNRGYQCLYCEYMKLCELDYLNPSEYDRDYLIQNI